MRKGAVVLSLLLLILRSPLSAKDVFVNDYAVTEPYVEVSFLKQPSSTDKSDAAMVVCYGRSGTDVYTIDGGRANGTLLTALNNLRSALLDNLGFSDKIKDPAYKLRITCLVSHCHPDHVEELTNMLFSSPRFGVDALFLPEATMLSDDGSYDNAVNCDLNERPALLDALGKWHPDAKVIQVPFGTRMEIPLDEGGMIRLFAPSCDWGKGEPLEYIRKVYYGNANALKVKSDVPLAVNNSDSMWVQVVAGGRKILFTGDVLKKKDLKDEPFDRMVNFYGEDALRSDVVKYPHHGISRDSAAEPLRELLLTDASSFVVVTASSAKRKSGPILDRLGIPWLDASAKDVVFRMEGDSLRLE
jgi:hypothetical protein